MEWFYAVDETQLGPVTEADLRAKFASGEIRGETLIWHEGLDDWAPYSSVIGEAATTSASASPDLPELGLSDASDPDFETATCAFSGRVLPKEEMLQYGEQWIAPEHKEAFIQQLQEGGPSLNSTNAAVAPDLLITDLRLASILKQSWLIWIACLTPILVVTVAIWLPLNLLLEYISYHLLVSDAVDGPDVLREIAQSNKFYQHADFWGGSLVAGATLWMTDHVWRGGAKVGIGEAFSQAFSNWGRLLLTRFLYGLFLVLLLLPCILFVVVLGTETLGIVLSAITAAIVLSIYMIRMVFAEAAAVGEEIKGTAALGESGRVTKGRFWLIVGYQIVIGGIIMVPFAIFLVIGFLPFLDTFVGSAIISTITDVFLGFGMVATMVFYRHLTDGQFAGKTTHLPQL